MAKICARCRRALPLESFGTHSRANRIPGKRYVNSRCRECVNDTHDHDKARNSRLKLRYGISSAEFDTRLATQGGCAACGSTTPGGKWWHIDHDHNCCTGHKTCGKCIRAILCHGCNTALGNLDDNPVRVAALLRYAEEYCG